MKLMVRSFTNPVLSIIAAVAAFSCVDKDYRIDVDDLDTQVHVSPGGVSIPLANIDRKTLDELIGSDIEGLVLTSDGYYALRYEDSFDYNIAPIDIPSMDDIGEMFTDVDIPVDTPSFDFSGDTEISKFYLARSGDLPVSGNIAPGTVGGTIGSSEGKIEIDFGLPEEVASVETVWLGPHALGTPMTVTFDIGALRDVSDEVTLKSLTVDLPARYTLGNPSAGTVGAGPGGGTANRLTVTDYIVDNSGMAVISLYIKTLTLGDKPPMPVIPAPADPNAPAWEISFIEDFGYSLEYSIQTRAGYVDPAGAQPSLVIDGSPEFKDASFTTKEIDIDASHAAALDYRIGIIPPTVEKLVSVSFVDDANTVVITVDDPELPFRNSEPEVRIGFPAAFVLDDPRVSGSVLTAPLSAFTGGYPLRIDRIDLGDDGIPGNDRYIDFGTLGYEITASIDHTFAPEAFTWSTDIDGWEPLSSIKVDMDVSNLRVSAISAELDLSLDEYIGARIQEIDLTDISEELGNDEISPDLVAPTIIIEVTNPLGISVEGALTLDPKTKDGTSLGKVTIDDLLIEPSDEEGSEVTYIFIAENGASTPTDHVYTRYNAALGNLVETIPATIEMELSARARSNRVQTFPVGEPMPFGMSYAVDMPLIFGENMDVRISLEQDGLNDTFRDLADARVKASDIMVEAELEVSFPFRMEDLTVEFADAAGNPVAGLTTTILGAIEGPEPGSGQVRTSTLTVAISVPDGGDFETLSEIEILKFVLPVTGTGEANRLRPDDYISGRAWITLANGVKLDIQEF